MKRKLSLIALAPIIMLIVFITKHTDAPTFTKPELKYLAEVHKSTHPEIVNKDDATLVSLGNLTCKTFRKGTGPDTTIEIVVKAGHLQEAEPMGVIIRTAIIQLCPDYKFLLD